jgi:antitoxin MazE
MQIPIIPIGNSKGIRLSKTILEKYNFKDEIEILLEKDYIILKPKTAIRKGWDEMFKEMSQNQDDELLIQDIFDDEQFESWD